MFMSNNLSPGGATRDLSGRRADDSLTDLSAKAGSISRILIVHDCATESGCIARALAETSAERHVWELDFAGCEAIVLNPPSTLPDVIVLFVDEIGHGGEVFMRQVRPIRPLLKQVPFVAVTDDDNVLGASAELFRLGASGCISHATGLEGLTKMLWLVLHGGVCFPRGSVLGACTAEQEVTHQIGQSEPARDVSGSAKDVADGEADDAGMYPHLTQREADVVQQLRMGKPNKIIAYELGISISTVKVHLRNIMRKTGATNRVEAALRSGKEARGSFGSFSIPR